MNTYIKTSLLCVAAVSLAACETTDNVERDTVRGTAIGAAIGAGVGAISGDVGVLEGAAVGAGAGAIGGAIHGSNKDKRMQDGTIYAPDLDRSTRYQDANGRYYYYEKGTNRTFFENGDYRSG
ncbi:YMGG-like glycine zipper-containing protein [uncultured Algimonas sp.]|uniref:YMGG-like glycine zipper-containing protein n=1 Tax=uncultured Algimonas sp. TaxID=1547920 RepID=UPI002619F98F|nr:YMGG-like glycine zipper-containing protein [uncultured Algimonas sp.]